MTVEGSTTVGALGHFLNSHFLPAGFCPQNPYQVANIALNVRFTIFSQSSSWLASVPSLRNISSRKSRFSMLLPHDHSLQSSLASLPLYFQILVFPWVPNLVLFSSSPSSPWGVHLPTPCPNNHLLMSTCDPISVLPQLWALLPRFHSLPQVPFRCPCGISAFPSSLAPILTHFPILRSWHIKAEFNAINVSLRGCYKKVPETGWHT